MNSPSPKPFLPSSLKLLSYITFLSHFSMMFELSDLVTTIQRSLATFLWYSKYEYLSRQVARVHAVCSQIFDFTNAKYRSNELSIDTLIKQVETQDLRSYQAEAFHEYLIT